MRSHEFILMANCLNIANAWWQPDVGTTWQITLSTTPKAPFANVTAFDFDLFDTPTSTLTKMRAQGIKTICYFSAGSYEEWRSDKDEFQAADLGKPLDGWEGERWLDTTSGNVRAIMSQRMDLAVQKGCDAIDPDNIDAYDNGGGGFELDAANAVDYVNFLAQEGHDRGLATGLKNGGRIVSQVLPNVDFQVNEQCLQYNECSTFRPFIDAGKPVFHIEYRKGTPKEKAVKTICARKGRKSFSTLIKHMSLNAFYEACPGNPAAPPQATDVHD